MIKRHLLLKATTLLCALVLGFVAVKQSRASLVVALTTTPVLPASNCGNPPVCAPGAEVGPLIAELIFDFQAQMRLNAIALEGFAAEAARITVIGFIDSMDGMEDKIVKWWGTMWQYTIYPAMRAMTNQIVTLQVDQTKATQRNTSATNLVQSATDSQGEAMETHRMARPSENTGKLAGASGGQSRAESFSRAMRSAWSAAGQSAMSNVLYSPGGAGSAGYQNMRFARYRGLFCDPKDGDPSCTNIDPKFIGADTRPSQYIFEKTTLPIDPISDPNGRMVQTISAILDNLVGSPVADPLSEQQLRTSNGQEQLLFRRAYLARYNAARSIPEMVAGWRVPGSLAGPQIKSLRQEAGVNAQSLSPNPSYREIMQAISAERFSSGKFAGALITDQTQIELEKLTTSALYLMNLRDYYELLERTALVLSIQVSMMADSVPTPDGLQ